MKLAAVVLVVVVLLVGCGQRHGQGTYTFPDGTTYTGEFKDGKPVP